MVSGEKKKKRCNLRSQQSDRPVCSVQVPAVKGSITHEPNEEEILMNKQNSFTFTVLQQAACAAQKRTHADHTQACQDHWTPHPQPILSQIWAAHLTWLWQTQGEHTKSTQKGPVGNATLLFILFYYFLSVLYTPPPPPVRWMEKKNIIMIVVIPTLTMDKFELISFYFLYRNELQSHSSFPHKVTCGKTWSGY